MMSLHAHLRIRKASLTRFKSEIAKLSGRVLEVRPELVNRIDYTAEILDYYDMTASSLREQLQNLLSLVCQNWGGPN
jgi:hypothetical protein